MAKSINIEGTVDRTLVQGARALAKEKYEQPPLQADRGAAIGSAIADSLVDAVGSIKKKKEQLEIEHEKNLEPFQEIADKTFQKLHSQKEPLPQKIIDAVEDEVKRLQAEFDKVNVVGKGDTRENERARMKITAELTRITNEVVNTRADFMKMSQSAGNWNPNRIDPENIDPLKSILDLENFDKNPGVNAKFVDGKLTFTTKDYSTGTRFGLDAGFVEGTETEDDMPEIDYDSETEEEYKYGEERVFTSSDMTAALPSKMLSNDALALDNVNSYSKQGVNDGKSGGPNYFRNEDGSLNEETYDEAKNAYAGEILDKKQFDDFANRRMQKIGQPSFKMGLIGNLNIPIAALDNMFMDQNGQRIQFADVFASMDSTGPDGNPDGSITKEDLVGLEGGDLTKFEQNVDTIIDALTNINHPAFHFETSRDMLADYYTNINMQAYERKYYASGGKKTQSTLAGEDDKIKIDF